MLKQCLPLNDLTFNITASYESSFTPVCHDCLRVVLELISTSKILTSNTPQ